MAVKTNNQVEVNADNLYGALESANLNFIAEQSEIINASTGIMSKTHKSLYRSDTREEIGIVGKGYMPVQNTDAFSFFDTLCNVHGIKYNKITSINNGAKIIIGAKFPAVTEIKPNDIINREFNLINSFDGSGKLRVDFIVNRQVCSNGLRANIRDASKSYVFKHTKNIMPKMQEAILVFDTGMKYFDLFIEQSRIMANKMVDSKMVDDFLNSIVNDSDSKQSQTKKDEIRELFEHGQGNNGQTAWDLYNGLTEYVDHFHGRSEETRLEYSTIGQGVGLKEYAFDLCMKM